MNSEVALGTAIPESATPAPRDSRSLRYDSLTFWRGIACLLVVIYHSILYWPISNQNFVFGLLRQLWIGVPVFFVISGYCITASADALGRRPVPVTMFFWRRFRRIFPPYWIWLGIMVIAVYWVETFVGPGFFRCANVPPLQEMTKWRWLGNITLTEMWRTHVTGEPPTAIFWGPGWTLCYEEQFYVVMGLILLFARRFLFRAAALISAVVIAGPFFISQYDQKTYGTFLNCLWLAFAAGVLAYYALNYADLNQRNRCCLLLIASAVCVVADPRLPSFLDGKWILALCGVGAYYVWKHCSPRWRCLVTVPLAIGLWYAFTMRDSLFRRIMPDTGEHCFVAFLFAFLIIVLKKWDDSINRSKALAPVRRCGEMCYSIYLVHWPVVVLAANGFHVWGVTSPAAALFIAVPSCVAVTLAIALVFHRFVERPFWNPRI
jgi:peptidoglycan/LPS O-acetylase OafA/YrhL